MARGVNKVILIGNLGQSPEIKYLPSGDAVANLSIATSESWKDKTTGETVEQTEWHKVVFFKKLAEVVEKYVKKGSKIYVEGSLKTEKWTDNTGLIRYTTKIIGQNIQLLDSKNSFNSNQSPEDTENLQEENFNDEIPF